MPTYPLYTAVLAKLGAKASVLPARSGARLDAGSRAPREPGHAGDARDRRHRSEQPDRRGLLRPTTRRALLDFADAHGLLILADEVYGDLGFDGPVDAATASSIPTRRSSRSRRLSKAYLAPGWRTGWMACGRSPRLDDVVGGGEEAGGRPAVQHGADAVRDRRRADGDRSHQPEFREALKARADLTDRRGSARCRASPASRRRRRSTRCRRSRCRRAAPTRTTCKALLHATGVLCVYGSGFGLPAEDGFLRIVFLAPLDELTEIYDLMAAFTADYLTC